MTESFELEELLNRYAAGSCTREDFERLLFLVARSDAGETEALHWQKSWEATRGTQELSPEWQQRLDAMMKDSAEDEQVTLPAVPAKTVRPRKWLVAAAALFFLVAGYLIRTVANREEHPTVVATAMTEKGNRGHERATLTLTDGRQIGLDTASRGYVAVQSGVKISKGEEGEVLYYAEPGKESATGYNSISVPRSGNYAVVLSDGTKVHLNAASTLRFPVAFSGPGRDVELSGEGYFEVVKNPLRPFHVKTNGFTVEVFGTHFNVKSYPEDGNASATLVEGKVRIQQAGGKRATGFFLKPNQEAELNRSGNLRLNTSPNMEEVLAWQSNTFRFANRTVSSILADVGRWYDVPVVYHGAPPEKQHLTGTFSRNTQLPQLIAMLRYAGVKLKLSADHSLVVGE